MSRGGRNSDYAQDRDFQGIRDFVHTLAPFLFSVFQPVKKVSNTLNCIEGIQNVTSVMSGLLERREREEEKGRGKDETFILTRFLGRGCVRVRVFVCEY